VWQGEARISRSLWICARCEDSAQKPPLPEDGERANLNAVTALEAEPGSVAPRTGGETGLSVWDEVMVSPEAARAHWQPLKEVLEALGRDELASRVENSRRILGEHGVSCFSPGPGSDREVPWDLDLIPFVVATQEWRELEIGLVQRARLLNKVLGDLHSVQRLIRDGFIPAPLIYANPGYLRACQATRGPGEHYLHTYAADLARGSDGRWRVVADRTQTPSGLGFAMENRTVLSRVLPEAVRALSPRSLSTSLASMLEALRRSAPTGADSPAIVLLTPGRRNEAYFEHVYLARMLGFTLVEGGDLTVRDRRVFLKTLDGLRPVDVILRRVNDAYCDSLALNGESLLGVPGLVEATRAGGVSVVNALGSGLVESPAFLPFLPGLAQHLLGEDLRLPSIDTWWCGQSRERRYVESHLDELFLRPAFVMAGPQSRPGTLNDQTRAEWLTRLRERPYDFVGQQETVLSRAQTANGRWRPVVLRVFVLFNGDDYAAIPGGIVRLMEQDTLGTTALSLNGGSKDVWIMPDEDQVCEVPQVVATPQPALERLASDLPSRTAENLFWLGRYTERLEQMLRTCRSANGCLGAESANGRITALAAFLQRLGLTGDEAASQSERENLQANLLSLLFNQGHELSVRDLLERIHSASFSVRDRLSADTWRILNRLGTDAGSRPTHLPLVFASAILNALILDLAAFSGMEMENMTRGNGWVFLDLGRRIERSISTALLIEATLTCDKARESLLEPVLEMADSVMTYRRRYFAEPQLAGVLELLLLDPTNPRSLKFQLSTLQRHAESLPAAANPEGVAEIRQGLEGLSQLLDLMLNKGFEGEAAVEETITMLNSFVADIGAISDLVTHVYFSQVLPRVS
jgi:uncharacterized circularly permuted ATP-grasp superfamily protein/uncharacterized alpha-E superfamily protein